MGTRTESENRQELVGSVFTLGPRAVVSGHQGRQTDRRAACSRLTPAPGVGKKSRPGA